MSWINALRMSWYTVYLNVLLPSLPNEYPMIKQLLSKWCLTSILPTSFKLIRIGKVRPDSSHPIKLIFGSKDKDEHLLSIYKEKKIDSTLPPDFCVAKDKIPLQRMLLRNCYSELDRRSNAGENGLRIYYVDVIPKVVLNLSLRKNVYHHQTVVIH